MPKNRQVDSQLPIKRKQKRFVAASVTDQVRLSLLMARSIVRLAVEDVDDRCEDLEGACPMSRVSDLTGVFPTAQLTGSEADFRMNSMIVQYAEGAYALGIAVGLLMPLESFTGGAR